MNGEELAELIIRDSLAWRIWMSGYEAGLAQGHEDERAGMEAFADVVARRQFVLERCREHVVAERVNTLSMAEVRRARSCTRIGGYTGGPVSWDRDGHE